MFPNYDYLTPIPRRSKGCRIQPCLLILLGMAEIPGISSIYIIIMSPFPPKHGVILGIITIYGAALPIFSLGAFPLVPKPIHFNLPDGAHIPPCGKKKTAISLSYSYSH